MPYEKVRCAFLWANLPIYNSIGIYAGSGSLDIERHMKSILLDSSKLQPGPSTGLTSDVSSGTRFGQTVPRGVDERAAVSPVTDGLGNEERVTEIARKEHQTHQEKGR